jgi:hypothetical protein
MSILKLPAGAIEEEKGDEVIAEGLLTPSGCCSWKGYIHLQVVPLRQ